jgi:ribokinase
MITVVGSLVMDITIHVPALALAPGEVVHGHHLQVACGGKGANQACAVSRLGGQSALIGVVGVDLFGDAMLAALAAERVDTRGVVRRADGASGCFVVAADPAGQTEIVVANGINASLSAADIDAQAHALSRSRVVIAQLETSLAAVERALQRARQAGALTVLNAAPTFRFQPRLLPWCDVVVMNEHEAAAIAGMAEVTPANARVAAARIKALAISAGVSTGAAAWALQVLITLGAQGVWVDDIEACGYLAAPTVIVVDTLGAGDTFVGALAVRLSEGATLRAAAEFATVAASISVTRPGALPSIPQRHEVDDFGAWQAWEQT